MVKFSVYLNRHVLRKDMSDGPFDNLSHVKPKTAPETAKDAKILLSENENFD